MIEPSSPPRIGWSIIAVIAGLVTVVVTHVGTDIVMHAVGALPKPGEPMSHAHGALALAYRLAFSVLGGYVTALLAPSRPVTHAVVLGVIGLVLATLGAVATWNAGPAYGPVWYPLALVITALPCSWAGGRIYLQRVSRSTGHAN